MSRFSSPPAVAACALLGLFVTAMVVAAGSPAVANGQTGPATGQVVVSLSDADISARTGDTFTFTSKFANTGTDATPPLVAHLNIASLGEGPYVDPEDWSPERRVSLAPIGPGSSAIQSWTIHSILGGDFAIYIVLVPDSATVATRAALVASPAMHLHVDEQRNLNPGGVLLVVIATPAALAAMMTAVWAERRRGERRRARRQ